MPTTYSRTETRCYPCEHLNESMFKSGRDPIWKCECKHPEVQPLFKSDEGRSIETGQKQPFWCPLRNQTQESRPDRDEH